MDPFTEGASRCFQRLLQDTDNYAVTPWPVLLLGETGVGKEFLARRLHLLSLRPGAFVPVNCGAIPVGLFESELFGHEKGAFSGASSPARGLVRQAHGGTLFLDEIGELPFNQQAKLLRLLDSGEVRAVGSARVERADIRVVAATNRDLGSAVEKGEFRLDLLERLSALVLRVPALRERPEDILPLARGFLTQFQINAADAELEPLLAFPFPGNVRQLKNILVRSLARGRGRFTPNALITTLSEELSAWESNGSLANRAQGSLAEIEKQVIVDRLKKCGGNRKLAAKELGIAKSTLHEKLRRWKGASLQVVVDSPSSMPGIPVPGSGTPHLGI